MDILLRCWKEDCGQDLIEYGLLVALISVVCVGAIQSCGATLSGLWGRITAALTH